MVECSFKWIGIGHYVTEPRYMQFLRQCHYEIQCFLFSHDC